MTCKDCIHYEACNDWSIKVFPRDDNPFPFEANENENLCDYYKNKEDVAEVKHGEWKHTPSIYDEHSYVCSGKDGCGRQLSILGNPLNYCPYCGAKMSRKG